MLRDKLNNRQKNAIQQAVPLTKKVAQFREDTVQRDEFRIKKRSCNNFFRKKKAMAVYKELLTKMFSSTFQIRLGGQFVCVTGSQRLVKVS